MKPIYILQSYLVKELLKTLFLSLIVITSILFMAMLLQLMGKLSVVDIGSFVDFLPGLLSYLLGYTLSLAMLVSTTLTFGKFAGDNEFIAMKSCGFSPVYMMTPVILLSLYVSLLNYYLNDQVVPQSHLQKRQLMHQAIDALITSSIAQDGSTIEVSDDFRISYFKFEDGIFYGLVIHRIDNNQAQEKLVAEEGSLEFDSEGQALMFKLKNGTLTKIDHNNTRGRDYASFTKFWFPIKVNQDNAEERALRPKYQTMLQLVLVDEMISSELKIQAEQELAHFYHHPPKLTAQQKQQKEDSLKYAVKASKKKYQQVLLEIHRRIAFSMSCFFWVLVAMGMSLLQKHRVLSFGLSAILVTSIYYPLLMLGEQLVMKGYDAFLCMWIANIATGILGLGLIWKALRH